MRGVMFLRHTKRKKDGKEHRYWSIVENRRVGGGRVVQRPLLYLGEINDSQELAWRKSIAVIEEGAAAPRPLSLFPEDRCEGVLPDAAYLGPRRRGTCSKPAPAKAGVVQLGHRGTPSVICQRRWCHLLRRLPHTISLLEGSGFELLVPQFS